jgi:diguanylate cyclase (GGDEF)-like protein
MQRALAAGDIERARRIGRRIVADLLARGVLVRVAVAGRDVFDGSYCLVRRTSRLVDVAPLGRIEERHEPPPVEAVEESPVVEAREREPDAPRSAEKLAGDFDSFSGVLGAMEEAQDLEIGDPKAFHRAAILAGILRLLERFLPRFRLYVMLPGEDASVLETGNVFVPDDPHAEPPWIFHRRPGSSVWIPDVLELPRFVRAALSARPETEDGDEADWLGVAVPLADPDAVEGASVERSAEIGLLFLLSRPGWERDDLLRLARRIVRFVSRRWRHQRDMNRRIHTDSLTGLRNRAYFDSQFALELERAKRSDSPMTLVLGDLDRFKSVNDRYGHPTGDRVLREVARWLQDELRRIDHVCRIGGEEFALILPHTSRQAAREVVARLLSRPPVIHGTATADGERLRVTLSYGVVTYPNDGADAFELYRKADAMLYLSKESGRHVCHVWNDAGEPVRIEPPSTTAS